MPKQTQSKDLENLSDLDKKIQNIKSEKVDKHISTSGAGFGMKIATDMLAGVLVGLFIGYQMDSYFQTKPLWLIVFLIIGMFAGISNVIKSAKRLEQEKIDRKGK